MNLDGRVAIVTGGSRGIGLAVADRLARAGARVVLCGRDETRAEDAACKLRDDGGDVAAVRADVADPESVKNMVKKTLEWYDRIDVLVNNAGIVADGLLLRMTDENWQKVLDTNLTGVFNCTKLVARAMLKQRYGRIVTIGSVVGLTGNPGQANYCAAKAGVIGFTKAIARELGNRGITANVVLAEGRLLQADRRSPSVCQSSHADRAVQMPIRATANSATRSVSKGVPAWRAHQVHSTQ